jgi:hypothetical protein
VLNDRAAVVEALRGLVSAARAEGFLARSPEVVALLIADGSFKMATAPIEGDAPRRADGDRMSRWILRDLLPVDEAEIRADWVVTPAAAEATAQSTLLSLGGVGAVLAEYESLTEELGWTTGRLVPWSFAAAAARRRAGEEDPEGADIRPLVLCDADGALGALFESHGQPALHRSWRSAVPGERVGAELPALRRYVSDRLETTIGAICLCGEPDWIAAAQDSIGVEAPVVALTPEAAMCAVLED